MSAPKKPGKSVLNLREPIPGVSAKNQLQEILWFVQKCILLSLKFLLEAIHTLLSPSVGKLSVREVVLITGAGHGVGRELALQYAFEGATVVCWDSCEEDNKETVGRVAEMGFGRIHGYVCNVADRNDVMEVAKKVQNEVGDVTILINNAEIMPCHSFLDYTADDIEKVHNINIMGHYWTLQAFLPTMLKNNHGHIVAVSSCAGLGGIKNLVPYSASKFAIRGLMESLLQELRADPRCQVKTTIVYPYAVNVGLCKRAILLQFPHAMALLNPRFIAKCILNAQRREVSETAVPWFTLFATYFLKLLPIKVFLAVHEYLSSCLEMKLCNC